MLVFAAINFTVLSKLYKYTARRHSLHSDKEYIHTFVCCLYTKRKEVVFAAFLFSLPVLPIVVIIASLISHLEEGSPIIPIVLSMLP